MAFLFSATLFLSAFLLFLMQPMIGKMILPKFGGTPAVWNTCMLFFQAALLAGYGYAHGATTWLGLRRQTVVHAVLLVLPAVSLPIIVSPHWAPRPEAAPAWVLLGLLLTTAGLPFLMVSTTGPLLQKWFASSSHEAAKDPYFLYAASNAGSLLALISYPAWVEPLFPLRLQSWLWTGGYILFAVLVLACALAAWRFSETPSTGEEQGSAVSHASAWALSKSQVLDSKELNHASRSVSHDLVRHETSPSVGSVSLGLRCRWAALAFVPSSLMLGITNYISTDIAPIPLIWVIPLALYLVTFILAFGRLPRRIHSLTATALPVLVLFLILLTFLDARPQTRPAMGVLIPAHLLTFFVAALLCHSTLAQNRPPTRHLTEYYLWISVGGVLGGIFNSLLAPVLFQSLIEYPLAMVLACLLMPPRKPADLKTRSLWLDWLLPACLGLLTLVLLVGLEHKNWEGLVSWFAKPWTGTKTFLNAGERLNKFLQIRTILQLALPLAICYSFARRPSRFGLGIGAILLAGGFVTSLHTNTLDQQRNFFGVVRVFSPQERDLFGELTAPEPADFHFMLHGNIVHGAQLFRPVPYRFPLTYFYPTGPIGQVFAEFHGTNKKEQVAVIGLGAGILASYGERGQKMTFYEINPVVVAMAENSRLFTYLEECQADWQVVLGDGRLRLQEASEGQYGLIILDAFSSDAVPVHLLTREAFELYLSKLAPGGVIVMQLTNRYLELAPLAGRLAEEFQLVCREQNDQDTAGQLGKSPSHWAILARREADLGKLADDPRWKPVDASHAPLWTDDFSNILGILKWREKNEDRR